MTYVLPTQELGIYLWHAQCVHLFAVLTDNDYALADDGGDYVTAAIDLARAMNYICADGEVNLDWLDRLLNTLHYLSDYFASDGIAPAFYDLEPPALALSPDYGVVFVYADPFVGTILAQYPAPQ